MSARPTPRIAIVEDEETVREAVRFALRRAGYDALTFGDGLSAVQAFDAELPDLVILDITLPRMDGLDVCRRLRARSEALPIIFLTSRDEEFDRVLGLEIGADDYMCKPFSMRELLARVKVLLRRAALSARDGGAGEDQDLLERGALLLDQARYIASWNGTRLPITVTEFLLLRALVRHEGHVKTRAQLMGEAYGEQTFVSDRTIDSHIKRLRRKLSDADRGCDIIETVYGLGYRSRMGAD
jgi:two-component system, OmpR family, response regulator ChvI